MIRTFPMPRPEEEDDRSVRALQFEPVPLGMSQCRVLLGRGEFSAEKYEIEPLEP